MDQSIWQSKIRGWVALPPSSDFKMFDRHTTEWKQFEIALLSN